MNMFEALAASIVSEDRRLKGGWMSRWYSEKRSTFEGHWRGGLEIGAAPVGLRSRATPHRQGARGRQEM